MINKIRQGRMAFTITCVASMCWSFASAANTDASNGFFVVDPIFNSRTYVEQWGNPENPPVILVHGLGDNGASDWRHLVPELSRDFYVVTFDLPGFGRSEKLNALYNPDNYALFLEWISEQYVDGPFALIGHSMGGTIALNYAVAHSDRLTRLILIDAAGILHRTAFTKHLIDELKLPGTDPDAARSNLEELSERFGLDLEDVDRFPAGLNAILRLPALRGTLLGGDPKNIAGLALVQHSFSGKLARVTVPTLVIWGDADNVTPLRTGQVLLHRLPSARLEIIHGAGHMPMYDSTSQLNSLVLNELSHDPGKTAFANVEPEYAETGEAEGCDGENNRYINGRYKRVVITNCERLLIEDSRIDRLIIRNSTVEIVNSVIDGDKLGLEIENSTLIATASDFSADRAIVVSGSQLDFAGVRIIARERLFQAGAPSTVLFSVSHVRGPERGRYVHGLFDLSRSQSSF